MDLIVNLGDLQYLCQGTGQPSAFRHSWLSGERLQPIVIQECGSVDLIGVRFRPAGAWPVLHLPLQEFTGHVLELDSLPDYGLESLREQLLALSTDAARVRRLGLWLLRRLQKGPAVTAAVRYALHRLSKEERPAIGELVSRIGISHRHFVREFEKCVGLKPKVYARLRGFQHAIGLVGHEVKPDWSAIASACGYHDQAHLIHEFENFCGMSPSRYLERRGPFLNYLQLS